MLIWAQACTLYPTEKCECLKLFHTPCRQPCRLLAGQHAKHARSSNLAKVLKDTWLLLQSPVKAEELEEDMHDDTAQEVGSSKCCEVGRCICKGAGKQVAQMRRRLYQILKDSLPRSDAASKELLLGGHLCLRVLRQEEDCVEQTSDKDPVQTGEESSSVGRGLWVEGLWLHIGVHYLKPWRPTFQTLEVLSQPSTSRFLLRQTGEFLGGLEACTQLDLRDVWGLQVWRLVDSLAPVEVLDAAVCLVEAHQTGVHHLWPVPTKPRRRRAGGKRAQRKKTGLASGQAAPLPEGSAETKSSPSEVVALESEGRTAGEESDDSVAMGSTADTASTGSCEETDADMERGLDDLLLSMMHRSESKPVQEAAEADVPADVLEQQDPEVSSVVAEANQLEAAQDRQTMGPPLLPPLNAPLEPVSHAAEVDEGASAGSGARDKAQVVVQVLGGKVTLYKQGLFTATCDNPAHGRCVMSRTASAGRKKQQGRPIGFLVSWLAVGQGLTSKAAHWDKANWPSREARCQARDEVSDLPGGQELLDGERAQEPGEEGEPDDIP